MTCNGDEANVRFITDSPDAADLLERLAASDKQKEELDPVAAAAELEDYYDLDWLDKLIIDLIPEYAMDVMARRSAVWQRHYDARS